MSERYRFLNAPVPQTVIGPAVSAVLGCSEIFVSATADCFVCISAAGLGVDGGAVGATNGHFMAGGTSLPFSGLNATHKIGVNTGTIYISALG